MSGQARVLRDIADFHAADWIRAGDRVTWGQACAEPLSLTAALMEQRASIGRFGVFMGLGASGTIEFEHADCVELLSYTGGGGNVALSRTGLLDFLPSHYSDYPSLIASGRLRIDVVLLQLAPSPDAGTYSLSLADEWLSAAIDSARTVIAEVNSQAPWTHSRLVREDELDAIVHTSRSPAEIVRRTVSEVERRIAENVCELIEDGATLQIGLGAVPDAVLAGLRSHRDLGVHSGAIGDSVVELVEAGVITNAKKATDQGQIVAGALMGTERLFSFADQNSSVQVRDTRYTHDPARLAMQKQLAAINSAFEVDLTGQVNAEVAAGDYLGAVGGAMDFMRGAMRSPGGVPIIALPARSGPRARVVAELSGPVSTSRADVGIIVTEFGIADLRGLSLERRRKLMTELAHPEDRDELKRAARAG